MHDPICLLFTMIFLWLNFPTSNSQSRKYSWSPDHVSFGLGLPRSHALLCSFSNTLLFCRCCTSVVFCSILFFLSIRFNFWLILLATVTIFLSLSAIGTSTVLAHMHHPFSDSNLHYQNANTCFHVKNLPPYKLAGTIIYGNTKEISLLTASTDFKFI